MKEQTIYNIDTDEDVRNNIISIENEINEKLDENSLTREELIKLRQLQLIESMKLQIINSNKILF